MKFTIPLNPTTKKNSQRIFINRRTGKHFIYPSKKYKQYLKDCSLFLKPASKPINYPVNVKALYYRETRHTVDLCNLNACLHDVLVSNDILKDDNWLIIQSTDGSRVFYCKENSRTEVEITKIKD